MRKVILVGSVSLGAIGSVLLAAPVSARAAAIGLQAAGQPVPAQGAPAPPQDRAATSPATAANGAAPPGTVGQSPTAPSPDSINQTKADEGAGADANASQQDIVVTGFRRSLAAGVQLKREAIGVRDSIVAEDIGKFPEQNVADSLQRIPGVILSRDGASNEGQRISIRGLGSEFNVTTINGAPVRTTSSSNVGTSTRDFNFDVFPSELFGRVDIYKSPLANLEEGGIGGNVDLQTPRPFDTKGSVIRYQGSAVYNTQSKQWKPRGSLLMSKTWGNFGALFGVAYAGSANERSGFQSTGGYNSSALGSTAYNTPVNPKSGPFAYQLDLDNPLANLGGYTRDQVANAYLPRFYRVYTSRNDRQRLGLVGSLQYKSDRLEISFDGIYSQLKDSTDEYTFGAAVRNSRTVAGTTSAPGTGTNSGFIPLDVHIDEFNNLYGTFGNTSFVGESFYRDSETKFRYGILRGVYDIADNLKFSAQANLSSSGAVYSANRLSYNINGVTSTFDPSGNVSYPTISTPVDITDPRVYTGVAPGFSLYHEDDKERTARGQFDWKVVDEDGEKFSLLLGGSYVRTGKSLTLQDGSTIAQTSTLDGGGTFKTIDVLSYMDNHIQYGSIDDGGNSGYPSNFATFPRSFIMDFLDANGANRAASINYNSAFRADEIVTAGFFEANFETGLLGSPLRGNVGIRYADTRTVINNFVSTGGGQYAPQRRTGGYNNWLPSASLAFDITPKLVLRASAGKTITRVALANIAASTLVPNIFSAAATIGNPDLLPQTATQFDTGLEWYFSPGSLLSLGLFKKDISGTPQAISQVVPFSQLGLPDSAFNAVSLGFPNGQIDPNFPSTLTTYTNAGKLSLKGVEVAYQQTFSFLPGILKGLGITSSFTYIDRSGNEFVTSKGTAVPVSSVPKKSFSITPFFERGPVSIRASYNYRGKLISGGSNNTGNDQIIYTAAQGYLDATASYKISDALELRVDALNLTNQNVYTFYENPDQPKGNGKSRRDNSFYNGTTLSFGIRGKF